MGQKESQITAGQHAGWRGLLIQMTVVVWLGLLSSTATAEKLTTHPALDVSPAPSRDGRMLAFVSDRKGNQDIWLKALTAGPYTPPRQLTSDPAADRAPALNPDGSQLLYVSHKTDPRGDIFLMDTLTGKETRLTDFATGDSAPAFGPDGRTLYYLKQDSAALAPALYRRDLAAGSDQLLIDRVFAYAVGPKGWLVYSDGRRLLARKEADPKTVVTLTAGEGIDLWPAVSQDDAVFFTRYEADSNGDGTVTTDDESSIWMGRWNLDRGTPLALYRLTPAREFHVQSAAASRFVYFADLKRGDLYRLDVPDFLQGYAQLSVAKEQATIYLETGRPEQGLMMFENLSRNLVASLPLAERAEFDLAYADMLREAGQYRAARQVVTPYVQAEGRIGARAGIGALVLDILQQVPRLSPAERQRVVREGVSRLTAFEPVPVQGKRDGREPTRDSMVKGLALIESGQLLLLADDPLAALQYLVRADELPDKEIRAKALFTRGKVYRRLGDDANLLQVFVDVIQQFGEETAWGKRAVAQAIAVSEQEGPLQQKAAALNSLAERFPTLTFLSASALLRLANLYDEQGEQLKAVETLDRIIRTYPRHRDLIETSYRRKGELLAAAQDYRGAAEAYAALVALTGNNQAQLQEAKRLMGLQLVRHAVKKRSLGEARIAAKELRQVLQDFPDLVEAHRAYIETKFLIRETDEAQGLYRDWTNTHPDNPLYRYGWGLALSYDSPPDLPRIIGLLEQAVRLEPGITYFHQTLGWAYEQQERAGKRGSLEKAEQEYRIALVLNDGFQFPDVEANLLLNLGNTYMALHNYSEAYRHYRQRERRRPAGQEPTTELLYRKNYGEACFKTGRTEESVAQYQKALALTPADQSRLKAEVLERIGLSEQDRGHHAEAVRYFSEALELNLAEGLTQNLALLRRNIGVNLYNLGLTKEGPNREALKKALHSYFSSLDTIGEFGVKSQAKGEGLVQVQLALGQGGSQASAGFDRAGEEKLMFSYIASTYEKLGEPASARSYLLKKLARLPDDPAADANPEVATEKAVVLNRIGLLTHRLGSPEEAKTFWLESLRLTRSLGLDFGTSVNLYNLSRVAAERRLAGQPVAPGLLDRLVEGVNELLDRGPGGFSDRRTLALLSHVAFLLSTLPMPDGATGTDLQAAVTQLHRRQRAQEQAVTYYRRAQAILEKGQALQRQETIPHLIAVKLNLLTLALDAGKQDAALALRGEIKALAKEREAPYAWVTDLLEAEGTNDPQTREALLTRAIDGAMSLPAQVYAPGSAATVQPFYDGLVGLSVDHLVAKGEVGRAFAVAEQLAMRKTAALLFDRLGESFFLAGLEDYQAELQALLAEMRKALAAGHGEELAGLAAEFEELLFALYEEHPWAVSYFMPYPLNDALLAEVLSPAHPYIKVVPGRAGAHLFVHDGRTLRHLPLRWEGDRLTADPEQSQQLGRVAGAYLSLPSSLEGTVAIDGLSPGNRAFTKVGSAYDILNARHRRTVFYTRVAVAGALPLSQAANGAAVPVSLQPVQDGGKRDRDLLATHDVLVAAGPLQEQAPREREEWAIKIAEAMGVRETLSLHDLNLDLASATRHTALLLNLGEADPSHIPLLVSALIRAGYPHVVVNHGPFDPAVAQQFVTAYLTQLATLRPEAAALKAAQAEAGDQGKPAGFRFYGYAGMDRKEQAEFAAAVYADEVAEAVAQYQANNLPAALKRTENALALIDYTQAQQDFPQLTKLAVDIAFKLGEYRKAVTHQTKLLAFINGQGRQKEAPEVHYRLGILYSRLEQFDPAIQHLEKAIQLWTGMGQLDRLAESIATLGVIRENMGAYEQALGDFGRSYQLYEEIGEIEDMAAQHRRIGRIHYLRLGRYERAREHFTAALDIYRAVEAQRQVAETLFEIGLTYEKVGLFEDADRQYQAGFRIGEVMNDHFLRATGALYQANTAWYRGAYQAAFQHLARASEFAERAGDRQLTIMVANTKGLIYWTLNDLDKALLHVKQALALAEQEDIKTEVASSLNNLGLLVRDKGDPEGSLEFFERAKALDERLNSRWGLGYDYRNLGISLMKLNRFAEAETHFVKAERVSAEIRNTTNWVKALLELGNVHRATARLDQAREFYDRAFQLSARYGIKEVQWRGAAGTAAVLRAKGQKEEAVRWYATAVDVVEGMRAALKIEEFRNSFQANKQDLYRELISLLVEMGRTEDAFNYLERSRSRSFIDLLGNQKLVLKSAGDQKRLDQVQALGLQAEALAREVASFEKPPAELRGRHREAKARYEEALVDLKQSNPGLSSFVAVDPVTQPQVEKMLEPGVGLLSYLLAGDQVYIWLLTSRGTTFTAVPAHTAEIEALVKQYRQLVQRLEPVQEELQKLYSLLIQPVERQLDGLRYLGIVPDGPLHFLSFAALKAPDGYLIDRYPLFYTPSASVLKYTFAKRRPTKGTKVLAIGNPDLGSYNYDLPLAELEAQSIRWNFPQMDALTGSNATKEWLVDNISNYGIIHLAVHGEFDELDPLLSSLWLASRNPDNRRLTVKEVFSLDIRADLVTLSACQTGLGKLEAGELIGLNRAFIYAGTHALISALWRVDDLSTSVLMKHFYRNYATMNKGGSLRQAQLIVKKEFAHPAYWAGLSLIGDYQ